MVRILQKQRQALIDRWLERVLSDPEVPTANRLARPALEDHMPTLIDRLIERVATHNPDQETENSARHVVGTREIGTAHARHRLDAQYTAEETIRELSLFREALLELCDENLIVLTLDESKLVHLAIDEVMAANAAHVEETVFGRSEQVMAIVAHDLRNPVHIVEGYAQILKTGTPFDAKAVGEVLERSTRQMKRLIEDLLVMSKLEVGHMSIERERFDACDLVNEVLDQFRQAANRKRIVMTSVLPKQAVFIECDPARIGQALGNLVSNALKFTPQDGRIRVELEPTGAHVIFRVRDSGPGVSPEQRDNIFRPFWQGTETHRHGVGLGLAIVRGIVDAHGGTVSVADAPGEGAMFSVTLPMGEPTRPSKSFALDPRR